MAKPKANKLSVFAEIIFISIPFSKMGILENKTEIQKCFKTHIKVKNILKTRVTRERTFKHIILLKECHIFKNF